MQKQLVSARRQYNDWCNPLVHAMRQIMLGGFGISVVQHLIHGPSGRVDCTGVASLVAFGKTCVRARECATQVRFT